MAYIIKIIKAVESDNVDKCMLNVISITYVFIYIYDIKIIIKSVDKMPGDFQVFIGTETQILFMLVSLLSR